MTRHHDNLKLRNGFQRAPKRFDPVHFGHPDIEKDQIRRLGFDEFEGFRPALCGRDIVALILQDPRQGVENCGLIINDQNPSIHGALLMWEVRS